MRQITFTITEDEIRDVFKDISEHDLSDGQIKSILTAVECDEVLWEDIHNAIIGSLTSLI